MIRVAFVGKGGSGKSTISGSFARLLARQRSSVLALDSDPLPGMAYSLGVGVDDAPLPDDLVVAGGDDEPQWVLRSGLDAEQVVADYAVVGPDNVRYLQFGNLWGHLMTLARAQHAWSQVVRELDESKWNLVGDLPGGTRQPMFGWVKYARVVCLVVEPTPKSLHTAARLLRLREASWAPEHLVVVANKVRTRDDVRSIARRLEMRVTASVLADDEVAQADRVGLAPLDAAPAGNFATAVSSLVESVSRVG